MICLCPFTELLNQKELKASRRASGMCVLVFPSHSSLRLGRMMSERRLWTYVLNIGIIKRGFVRGQLRPVMWLLR